MPTERQSIIKVAVVGRANVGKTSLIDSLTGEGLRVGNFHGTTIDIQEVFFKKGKDIFCFYDTPGLDESIDVSVIFSDTSFCSQRRDQEIAMQFLKNQNNYDILLYVIDARSLAQELQCILNLKKLNRPVIIALNFVSTLQSDGCFLNTEGLSKELGIKILNSEKYKQSQIKLLQTIKNESQDTALHYKVKQCTLSAQSLTQAINKNTRLVKTKKWSSRNITKLLDSLFLHKIFGIPIFIAVMSGIFYATFTLGEYPANLISNIMTKIGDKIYNAIPAKISIFNNSFGTTTVKAFFLDGIVAGTKAVMEFIPKILIMTFFTMLIELTGYMSRISMLFYKSLRGFGLQGQSIIPLINGLGCTVPAIFSTRILPTRLDRLITIVALSFIPCHAKMLVFLFFTNIFFQEKAALAMAIIYICGISLALISAKVVSTINMKRHSSSFCEVDVRSLPSYKIPSLIHIWRLMIKRCKSYTKGVFTTVLIISGAIWIMANTPLNLKDQKYWDYKNIANTKIEAMTTSEQENINSYLLENSIIGMTSKTISPLFAPMNMDWRLCASLIVAFGAKEIALTAMSILYAGKDGYINNVKKDISIPTAAAYIAFLIIWVPCVSAIVAFRKEKSTYINTFTIVGINTLLAWVFSFMVYRIALLTV